MREEDKVNKTMFVVMTISVWLPELIILLLPNNILLLIIKTFAVIFLLERLRYNFRKEFNGYLPIGRYTLFSAVLFALWLLAIRTNMATILSIVLVLLMLYALVKIDKANQIRK